MAIFLEVDQTTDLGVEGSTDAEFDYSVSNPLVASVDAQGIVTALKPGYVSVNIMRKLDGAIEQVPVSVRPKPAQDFFVTVNGRPYQ